MDFRDIEELRTRPGLRLVLVGGVPSPWGQAAKAMTEYKGLEYAAGRQRPGDANQTLVAWAGVNSGPVLAWEQERPIDGWLDILNLLERLAPARPLLPDARDLRAEVVGLSNEICGEQGLGWNRRLSMFRPAMESQSPPAGIVRMAAKYGYDERAVQAASARQAAGLALLERTLAAQRARGRDVLVGEELTAVDFYWAAFSVLFDLPSEERIPVDPGFRSRIAAIEPEVSQALGPDLLAHRDWMLSRYFKLPMEF